MRDLKDLISFLNTHVGGEVNVGTMKNLSVPELRSWLTSHYARGVNARSNARALSVIRNFFKYIKNNYNIDNEAVFSLSKLIQRRTQSKTLSIPYIKTLVKEMKLSDLREPWVVKREIVIIVLLCSTGLRINKTLNLVVSDINNESLIVTGKENKQRQVFILPVVKKCIQEYVKTCPYLGINNETVFFWE